jgi:hypothetical protein
VHSTDRILPQFQTSLQGGDRLIRMARYAPCNPVALFEPQRALVLRHVNDTHAELAAGHARNTWAFILQPIDPDTTRLLPGINQRAEGMDAADGPEDWGSFGPWPGPAPRSHY